MRQRKRGGGARTPWERRRRRALYILMGVGLCIAPALLWRISIRANLNQQLSDLREAGVPLTLEELKGREAPAHGSTQTGAMLDEIFAGYTDVDVEHFEHLPRFVAGSPRLMEVPYAAGTRAALESHVSTNQAIVAMLMKAADAPRIRVVREREGLLSAGGADLTRPLEVLCAHACLLADQGDGNGAVESLAAGLQVARACRETITSETLNRGLGYEYMLASVLPSIALRAPISGERLASLESLIQVDSWPEDIVIAAQGDRCIQLHRNRVDDGAWGVLFSVIGIYDRRAIQILQYYDVYPELAALPLNERVAFVKSQGLAYDYSFIRPPLFHAYDPTVTALMRHYQREGRFPEALDGLRPAPAAGGGNGSTASYRVEESGFVLNDHRWTVTRTGVEADGP